MRAGVIQVLAFEPDLSAAVAIASVERRLRIDVPTFRSPEELLDWHVGNGLHLLEYDTAQAFAWLEAMASGLPVIATDIPPLNEMIVSGETGYLVECTVEGIRDAALLMVKQREETRRMGHKARERANEEFSLNVQASRVEHFYRQILDANPRTGQEPR